MALCSMQLYMCTLIILFQATSDTKFRCKKLVINIKELIQNYLFYNYVGS